MLLGILICVFIALSEARSPYADYFEELIKNNAFGSRISDNILEDAMLDLPDLVKKYNYPFEEHFVTTDDGYILGIHRIPHGRDSNNIPGDRPIAFIMHGLLSSSADHVSMGPNTAIAYVFAEAGFDVWMGNARGNYFSRRNIYLDPDDPSSLAFWQFSWDEIGSRDLPAMIDYALRHTGKSALHYIGISQGTTTFFVMGALRPDMNTKIISMHALAPVAYMGHQTNEIFNALAPHVTEIETIATLLGFAEILPRHQIFTDLGRIFCIDGASTQFLCSEAIFMIAGRNEDQHNATMLPVIMGHAPAGIALRQLAHYGQSIIDKQFRRFDHGFFENIRRYGTAIPPRYDLSRVTSPVYLHYAANDPLAHFDDVDRLYRELGNPAGKILVPHPTFSHADFMFGIDAKTLVYDVVINLMRLRESRK